MSRCAATAWRYRTDGTDRRTSASSDSMRAIIPVTCTDQLWTCSGNPNSVSRRHEANTSMTSPSLTGFPDWSRDKIDCTLVIVSWWRSSAFLLEPSVRATLPSPDETRRRAEYASNAERMDGCSDARGSILSNSGREHSPMATIDRWQLWIKNRISWFSRPLSFRRQLGISTFLFFLSLQTWGEVWAVGQGVK